MSGIETTDCLAIMAHALRSVVFDPSKISLGPTLYAAERANALVLGEGIPFREAYRRVAQEILSAVPTTSCRKTLSERR